MSKYLVVELEITEGSHIVQALEEMGVPKECIEVHETPRALYGYQNDMRNEKANIIVRKENVRKYFGAGAPNDLGFERMSNGKYRAVVSAYDKSAWWNNKENKFKQLTSVIKVEQTAKRNYFTKRVEENGKIKVILTSKR